ncbi:ABC transporter substrate-binding protein [Pseudonocardia xishanensis]|uniref:Leucine-binding protein domain-containing protein n=1 Tax=Pseudonocardia xishanensis TaxID=630995 RepID=A0ABP8RVS9_9PSEU
MSSSVPRRLLGVLAALSLGVLAACGSSSGGGTGTSGDIVIGVNNSDEGNGQDLAYFGDAVQAWANDLNRRGGIDGRSIRIERCNDQASEQGATFCTRQQVQNSEIVAALGYSPLAGTIQGPTYSRAGVPFMQLGARDRYSIDGTGSVLTVDPQTIGAFGGGLAQTISGTLGKKKIAVIRLDAASLDFSFSLVKQSFEATGAEIVADIKHPATTVDFTASVVQAKAAGADAVIGLQTTPGYIRLLQAAAAQDFRVPFGAAGPTLTPDLEKAVADTGATMVLNAFAADPVHSTDPDLVAFRDAMTASNFSADIPKAGSVGAWGAAKVLESALTTIGGDAISRDAVLKALTDDTFSDVPLFDGQVGRANGTPEMPALGYTKTYMVTLDGTGARYTPEPIDIRPTLERIKS